MILTIYNLIDAVIFKLLQLVGAPVWILRYTKIMAWAFIIIVCIVIALLVGHYAWALVLLLFGRDKKDVSLDKNVIKRQDEIRKESEAQVDSMIQSVQTQKEQSDARIQQDKSESEDRVKEHIRQTEISVKEAENQTNNSVGNYRDLTNEELAERLERERN